MYYPSIRYDMFHSARSTGDADAQAIIDAMGTTPDAARQALITTLVTSGKSHGWWTKGEWLRLYTCHSSDSYLLNWFNPGTFDGTAVNSPNFTVDDGVDNIIPTTAYINSNYNPSTDAIALTATNNGIVAGVVSRINVSAIGCDDAVNYLLLYPSTGGNFAARNFDNGTPNLVANTNNNAHFGAFRTGNTSEIYINKVQNSATISGAALINQNVYELCKNGNGSATAHLRGKMRYAGMFQYLTSTEYGHFVDDMETFLDAIGVGLI